MTKYVLFQNTFGGYKTKSRDMTMLFKILLLTLCFKVSHGSLVPVLTSEYRHVVFWVQILLSLTNLKSKHQKNSQDPSSQQELETLQNQLREKDRMFKKLSGEIRKRD